MLLCTKMAKRLLIIGVTLNGLFWPLLSSAWYLSPSSTSFGLGDTVTIHPDLTDIPAACRSANLITGYRWTVLSLPASSKFFASTNWYDPGQTTYFTNTSTYPDLADTVTVTGTWSNTTTATTTGSATIGAYTWGIPNGNMVNFACQTATTTASITLLKQNNTKNSGILTWSTNSNQPGTNTTSTITQSIPVWSSTGSMTIVSISDQWVGGFAIIVVIALGFLIGLFVTRRK